MANSHVKLTAESNAADRMSKKIMPDPTAAIKVNFFFFFCNFLYLSCQVTDTKETYVKMNTTGL